VTRNRERRRMRSVTRSGNGGTGRNADTAESRGQIEKRRREPTKERTERRNSTSLYSRSVSGSIYRKMATSNATAFI
jgi:hypothetical protein